MTIRLISDNEFTNLQAKDEWGKFDFIYSEFPTPALHSPILHLVNSENKHQ